MSRGASQHLRQIHQQAAECNTEAEARAGMGTVAHMTRVRAAAKILLADRIFFMQVHGIFLI